MRSWGESDISYIGDPGSGSGSASGSGFLPRSPLFYTFAPRASARNAHFCALTPLIVALVQKQGGGGACVFLSRNSDLASKSLIVRTSALFVRSLRSFTKECLRTPLQPTRSALFFKTAWCMGICNQILELELVEDSRPPWNRRFRPCRGLPRPGRGGSPFHGSEIAFRPVPLHQSGHSDRMGLNVSLTPHRETSPLFPVSKISRADTGCGNAVLPNPGQGSCHQAERPGSRPG
jgi:hypothetical protein